MTWRCRSCRHLQTDWELGVSLAPPAPPNRMRTWALCAVDSEDFPDSVNCKYYEERQMQMRDATLQREETGDTGTFGTFKLDDGWTCRSGELPWRNNANGLSCIPAGIYVCTLIESPHHGLVYHVLGVPDRSMVEIHAANWMGDKARGFKCELLGCIALGRDVGILNGQRALISSHVAIDELRIRLNKLSFSLTILDIPVAGAA